MQIFFMFGREKFHSGLSKPVFGNFLRHCFLFILLNILYCPLIWAATAQTMVIQGYVTHPLEGAYNQKIDIRLKIIKRKYGALAEGEAKLDTVWNKTYYDVPIFNGQFQLLLDEDDDHIAIDKDVFQSYIEYSFDGSSPNAEKRMKMADFPDGTYALRFHMRRSHNEEFEQIKPDFNIDGSPLSFSALSLDEADIKFGKMEVSFVPKTADAEGAVVTVDTQPGNLPPTSLSHGVFLENATVTIDTPYGAPNPAFHIDGSVFFRDSDLILSGNSELAAGNIKLKELCMSLDCEALGANFSGNLFAYSSVQFSKFFDSDGPIASQRPIAYRDPIYNYQLDPSGQSNFKLFSLSNLAPQLFPDTLRLNNKSDLYLDGFAGLSAIGGETKLFIGEKSTGFSGDSGGLFLLLDEFDLLSSSDVARFKFDNRLRFGSGIDTAVSKYRDPNFYKIKGGTLRGHRLPHPRSEYKGDFYFRPSSESNVKSLRFHFGDLSEAKKQINQKVSQYFASTPEKIQPHSVEVVYDPILTEEVLKGLLTNNYYEFHNHDLMAQAQPEELIDIINNPAHVTEKTIRYFQLDPILAQTPVSNIWQQPIFFNRPEANSFLLRGQLVTSWQGTESTLADNLRGVAILGANPEEKEGFLATGHYQISKVRFMDESRPLNAYLGSLNLRSASGYGGGNLTLNMESILGMMYRSHPAYFSVNNEFSVDGNLDVKGSFYSGGTQIFGCFHFPCPEQDRDEAQFLVQNDIYNVNTIGASRFFDLNMQNSLDPSESTTLADVEITERLRLGNTNTRFLADMKVSGNISIESGSAIIGSTVNDSEPRQVQATIFRSFTQPNTRYTIPSGKSYWTNLENAGQTTIEGNVKALSDIVIGGNIGAENALVYQNSRIHGRIVANIFQDLDSLNDSDELTMFLDPSAHSILSDLEYDGEMSLPGNFTAQANFTAVNDIHVEKDIRHNHNLFTPIFIDLDSSSISQPDYYIYPAGLSEIRELEVVQIMEMDNFRAEKVQIGGELDILGRTTFDGTLQSHGDTQIGGRLILAVNTDEIPECKMTEPDGKLPPIFNFCVDADGFMYARNLTLDKQGVFEQGVFGGVVKVENEVFFHPPTNFHELHVSIKNYLQLTDEAEMPVLYIDEHGHTSSVGRLSTTGFLRFLTDSAKGIIDRDKWRIGTESATVKKLSLERSDGSGLDLQSLSISSELSTALDYSRPFVVHDNTQLDKIFDAEDHDFYVEPNAHSVLRQLAQNSTQPVTVATGYVKTPYLHDSNDERYRIDPNSDSRLNILTVEQRVLLNQYLHIRPDIAIPHSDFPTKILIHTAETLDELALHADNFFSLSASGALSSSLELWHTGSWRLHNSDLKLGVGEEEVSINKLDMTTLLILPSDSYDAGYHSTTREYWADHLHYHDRIDEVDTELYARRSRENTFAGVNRFLQTENAIVLSPSSFSPSLWGTQEQLLAMGASPAVLPGDEYFVAVGENALYSMDTAAQAPQFFINLAAKPTENKYGAFARSQDGKLAFLGGLQQGLPRTDFYTYDIGVDSDWQSKGNELAIAYPQMMAVNNHFYAFGGYYSDGELLRPNVSKNLFSYKGSTSTIKHGSDFPARDYQVEDAVFYTRADELYRNKINLEAERLVLKADDEILAPQLSYDRIEICYHTPNYELWVYNLVTDTKKKLADNAHHCAWGHSAERDDIYFLNNEELGLAHKNYGYLHKIRKDGSEDNNLGYDELAIRKLSITADGQFYLVAQAHIETKGENLIVAVDEQESRLLSSDSRVQQDLFNFTARDFLVYQDELSFISTPQAAQTGNQTVYGKSKENLFLAKMDGTDVRQVSYFPQGISGRVAFTEAAAATVAVSAFYIDEDHLPLEYTGACSVQYGGYVYLFGSGLNKSTILQYHIDTDHWYELTEQTPGLTGDFSCAYDQDEGVYFVGDGYFARFDLAQKRFWPLDLASEMTENTAGPMAFSAAKGFLWFLDEQEQKFYEYNPANGIWQTKNYPDSHWGGGSLIALGEELYLFGNSAGQTNMKFVGSNWQSLASIPNGDQLHQIQLLPAPDDENKILLISGQITEAAKTVYLYDITANSFQQLPDLRASALKAGFAFDGQQQLYIFGGQGTAEQLQIYPLNAETATDFQQIFNLDLTSLRKAWYSSAPSVELLVAFKTNEFAVQKFAYAGLDGIYVYHQEDNSHNRIYELLNGVLTGLDTAFDREYIYFSLAEADLSEGHIYRILATGIAEQELSANLFSWTAGHSDRLLFVNPEHNRLYFLRDNQLQQAAFTSEQSPQAILAGTNIISAHLHKGMRVTELRDGLFLQADSQNLSSLETHFFAGLLLQDFALCPDNSIYFTAKPHFSTAKLYVWQSTAHAPQLVYDTDDDHFIHDIFYHPFEQKLWFTQSNIAGTEHKLFSLAGNTASEIHDIEGNPVGAFALTAFEPRVQRHRSFVYENRIYTLVGHKLYRTTALSALDEELRWSFYDSLSVINDNYWQITQYKNRIYFYDENTADIYEYFPRERQLSYVHHMSIAGVSGTLAVLDDSFYLLGQESVSQVAVLSQASAHLSLAVFSADGENVDGTAKKLFNFASSGQVFARELHGAADFTPDSISGGQGNLGILDGSLIEEDLQPEAIDSTKLANNIFTADHILPNQIENRHFALQSLETAHFQTAILNAEKIPNEQILTRHLANLSLSTDKIKSESLLNDNFSLRAIGYEQIATDTIYLDLIADLSLVALNFKDLDLIAEDFADDSLGSKQVLDGSIVSTDIASETIVEQHFQLSSVTTNKIASKSVIADKIADKTLTVTRFADFAIINRTLEPETIYGSAKNGDSINELESLLVSGAIHSTHIRNHENGIATENIGDQQITSDKLADFLLVGSEEDIIDESSTGVGTSKIPTGHILSHHIDSDTITNRELATASIDDFKVLRNSLIDCQDESWSSLSENAGNCSSSVLDAAAITISKIATGATAFSTDNIRDGQIIDRHFSAGGLGDISSFENVDMPSDCDAAFYQNRLYCFGPSLSALRLSDKSRQDITVYDVDNKETALTGDYAVAYDQTHAYLYQFSNATLLKYDFASSIVTEITVDSPSLDVLPRRAILAQGNFILLGKQDLYLFDLSANTWQTKPIDGEIVGENGEFTGAEIIELDNQLYLFGNGVYSSSDLGASWSEELASDSVNFIGSSVWAYNYPDQAAQIYIFTPNHDIYEFTPSGNSLSSLHGLDGLSDNYRVVLYQHRFYILDFTNANLWVWHSNLDASIASRHIDENAVFEHNIRLDSLSSVNFAQNSIDSERIQEEQVINVNINDNVLTTHSIAKKIFTSEHFKTDSITHDKISSSTPAIDSRVLLDYTIENSRFADDSIVALKIDTDAIISEAIAAEQITSDKIALEQITLAKVATEAVTGGQVIAHEIKTVDIDDLAIDERLIADQSIETGHILKGNILSRHIRDENITRSLIALNTLTADDFALDAFQATTMFIDQAVQEKHIAEKNITYEKISMAESYLLTNLRFADGAVFAEHIHAEAIQERHIATDVIESRHIVDNSLLDRSFADDSIDFDKLAPNSLTEQAFATGTLTYSSFVQESLTAAVFALDSIRTEHFVSFSLDTDNFMDGGINIDVEFDSVDTERFVSYTLEERDFSNGAVKKAILHFGSILGRHISTDSNSLIRSAIISADQISSIKLSSNSFTEREIAASALTATKIQSYSLSGNVFVDNTLDGGYFAAASVGGYLFVSGTVPHEKFADYAMTGDSIAPYQIHSTQVQDLAIQAYHIQDNAVDNLKLAADSIDTDRIQERSIRGSSIISDSLSGENIATGAIRTDLIQDLVINQRYSLAGEAFTDATTRVIGQLGAVIPLADHGHAIFFKGTGEGFFKTADNFQSETEYGAKICEGGSSLGAVFLFDAESGYATCGKKLYLLDNIEKGDYHLVFSFLHNVIDLYFFDRAHGVVYSEDGIFSTADYGRHWDVKLPIDLPEDISGRWAVDQNSMVIPAGSKYWRSDNAGRSWTGRTLGDYSIYSFIFDPDNHELYASAKHNGTGSSYLLHFTADTSDLKYGDSFFSETTPVGQIVYANRSFYIPTNGDYGIIEYFIDRSEFIQVGPDFAHISANNKNVGVLTRPLYLGDRNFIFTEDNKQSVFYALNAYEHISTDILSADKLTDKVLTTGHFLPFSIAGEKVADGQIAAAQLKPAAFTQGEYTLRQEKEGGEEKYVRFFFGPKQGVFALDDSGKLYLLTPQGENVACGSGISFVHGRGNTWLAVSATDLYFIDESCSNSVEHSDLPFDEIQAVWVFDKSNIFAFGRRDDNLIMAYYEPNLEEFQTVNDSAGMPVVITACAAGEGRISDVLFVNQNEAYISIDWLDETEDNKEVILSTSDGGSHWSVKKSFLGAKIHSGFYSFNQELNYYFINKSYGTLSDDLVETTLDGNISALAFVNTQIGFAVTADAKIYKTTDGGNSFSVLYELNSSAVPQAIMAVDEASLLLSGADMNLHRLFLPITHQPFTNLDGISFSAVEPLEGLQFRLSSLKHDNLASYALESSHFADHSLAANRLQDQAITNEKIKDYSLNADLFVLGSISNDKLKLESGIHGDNIKIGLLTSDRIADGSISSQELSTDALGADSIIAASITTPKIGDGSISVAVLTEKVIKNEHLIDGGFDEEQFAAQSFGDEQFATGTITADRLFSPLSLSEEYILTSSLTGKALLSEQITDTLLGTQSLYHYLISTATILGQSLQNSAVTWEKWQDYAIDHNSLNQSIVSSDKISAEEVLNEHIKKGVFDKEYYNNSTLGASKLQDFSFTWREFQDGAIIASKFSTDESWLLTSSHFANEVVTSSHLTGQFAEEKFADAVFINQKLSGRIFTESKMQEQILTDRHFAPGLLTADVFAEQSIDENKLDLTAEFSSKLRPDSINGEKIASHSLNNDNFAADITLDKLHGRLFLSSHFGDVQLSKIAEKSISERVIKRAGLSSASIYAEAFTNEQFQDDSIAREQIADNFVRLGSVGEGEITSRHLRNYTLETDDFAAVVVIGSHIKDGTLTGREFIDEFLFGNSLKIGSLTTDKLGEKSIGFAEIADFTLEKEHIQNASLAASLFALHSLTDADFFGGIIGTANIAGKSIKTTNIADGTIENKHFAAGAVHGSHLDELISSVKIGENISGDRISIGAVTNGKLSGEIAVDRFSWQSISTENISDAQVLGVAIADNELPGNLFVKKGIEQDKIALAVISSNHLSDLIISKYISPKTIVGTEILDGTLLDSNFATDAITGGSIFSGSLPLARLNNGAISEQAIADLSITEPKIADQAITNDEIAAGGLDYSALNLAGIAESRIEPGSLAWSNLAARALVTTHFADGVVQNEQIDDGVFNLENIAVDALSSRHINEGSLTPVQFSTSISGAKFIDGVFLGEHISGQLSAGNFAQLSAQKIKAETVGIGRFIGGFSFELDNRSLVRSAVLTGGKFPSKLSGAKIADGNFTPAKLAAGSKFDDEYFSGLELSADKFSELTGGNIVSDDNGVTSGLLTSEYLASGSIGTDNIAAKSITTAMLDVHDEDFQKLLNLGTEDSKEYADDLHWHAASLDCGGGGDLPFCFAKYDNSKINKHVEACQGHGMRLCTMQELYAACKKELLGTPSSSYMTVNFNGSSAISISFNSSCAFSDFSSLGLDSQAELPLACCLSF